MAVSASTSHLLLLVSTVSCIFVSTCKFGRAFDDPRLGAAGKVTNEYVPTADESYPHEPGVVGTGFINALECLDDKNIYSSCDEAYRLTQNGEIHVPLEYTDQYCNGACVGETRLVLECIDEVIKHFVFYNKATVYDVKETIKTGCSYGPLRGNFNVGEHMHSDEAVSSKMLITLFYAPVLIIMGWHVLF